MRNRKIILGIFLVFTLMAAPRRLQADETAFAGNYLVPENQSGFSQEQYEVKVGRKLQRGAENFFLGWLEIPHGVKKEYMERKSEYLTMGVEPFFLGLFHGFMAGSKRTAIGLYEMISSPYPQEPVLEPMDEWLY